MFEKSCQCQVHRTWYRLHASCPEAEVSTYSTEFDGSQDFSNTLLESGFKLRRLPPLPRCSQALPALGLLCLFRLAQIHKCKMQRFYTIPTNVIFICQFLLSASTARTFSLATLSCASRHFRISSLYMTRLS